MNNFSDIVGQKKAIKTLINNLENEHLNHAYLFLGPAGIGKRTSAHIFARQIILQSDADAPIFFKENMHPDILVIKKEENKTLVSKEQITKILEPWLIIKPYRARNKVAIIEDSNNLSIEAENALLKTLEEPPFYAVIIMVSDENNLLETIISRCQIVNFFPIGAEAIEMLLLKKGIARQQARQIAGVCQGSIALALNYAEEGFEELWGKALEIVRGLAGSRYSEIFNASEEIEKRPLLLINLIQAVIRDIYIYNKTNKKELVLVKDSLKYSQEVRISDEKKLALVWQQVNQYKKYYRASVNKTLLTVNICFNLWEALH